jgi:hypothetical protein
MNRLNRNNSSKSTASSEATKTTTRPVVSGQMKMIDGVIVMLPPEDSTQEHTTEKGGITIEQVQDVILTSSSKDEEVQHVVDSDTEAKSRAYAAKLREENKQRAEQAKAQTSTKKVGDSITIGVEESTMDDSELFQQIEQMNNEN